MKFFDILFGLGILILIFAVTSVLFFAEIDQEGKFIIFGSLFGIGWGLFYHFVINKNTKIIYKDDDEFWQLDGLTDYLGKTEFGIPKNGILWIGKKYFYFGNSSFNMSKISLEDIMKVTTSNKSFSVFFKYFHTTFSFKDNSIYEIYLPKEGMDIIKTKFNRIIQIEN